jgi:hypothetical protein
MLRVTSNIMRMGQQTIESFVLQVVYMPDAVSHLDSQPSEWTDRYILNMILNVTEKSIFDEGSL